MKNSEAMKQLNTLKQIRLGLTAAAVVLMVLLGVLAVMKPGNAEAGSSSYAPMEPQASQSTSLPEEPDGSSTTETEQPEKSDEILFPELPDDIQDSIRHPEGSESSRDPFEPDESAGDGTHQDQGRPAVPVPQMPFPEDEDSEVTALSDRTLGYSQKLGPGQMDGVLGRMILSVSDEVDRMLGPEGRAKSGSTVVTALIRQGCFHWATVGDSHVYLYRNGKLLQLNQEHNRGQDMLVKAAREGLSFDEVRREKKSGLTSFLGMGRLRHLEQSLRSIPLQGGDRIVLSTDGVFDVLSDAAIAEVMRRNPDVQQAAYQLGRQVAARRNPRQDNYTAIILGV